MAKPIKIKFKKMTDKAYAPERKSEHDACYDLRAVWFETKDFTAIAHTDLQLEIPPGYEGLIRSRSGLAAAGVLIVNSPGTIDSNYRGEIKIILGSVSGRPPTFMSGSKEHLKVANEDLRRGDRIAQICIKKVLDVVYEEVNELSSSDRGGNGIGSSGLK